MSTYLKQNKMTSLNALTHFVYIALDTKAFLNVYSSTSVSSPGETMPRSDSADSQSQAIQEEPLPSTSNDDEDPLAGKTECFSLHQLIFRERFTEI